MHQRLSLFILGSLSHGGSSQAGNGGSSPLYSASHRETGPLGGLLEGQGKDPPWSWLFQPLSPWLTLEEGNMTQCPRSAVSWEVTRAGNWDTCWVAGAKTLRLRVPLCPSLAVTSGRLLPLWAPLSTQP